MPSSLFRARSAHGHHRVTYVELFFDLVFVFAVTQLSHRLLEHFDPLNAFQTSLLLLAVWWVWVFTSWVTNWLDPERTPVRLLLLVLMLAGLAFSTSIPGAFEARGVSFAGAYVVMQLGRTTFMRLAIPATDPTLRRNFERILIWMLASAVFWIAGACVEGTARLGYWGAALLIEYVSPAVRFWLPGLGASSVGEWNIEGGHLAERFALFVIIALGESILMTGAAFSACDWTGITFAAFAANFAGSVTMWWIYFDTGAELGSERIRRATEPGRLGRLAYTYLHLPIVAGIILCAVADELVLAHPEGHVHAPLAISAIGGPLLYLLSVLAFKRTLRGWLQPSHLVGIGLLLALIPCLPLLSPLALSSASSLVLVVVALWETTSLAPRRVAAHSSEAHSSEAHSSEAQ